MDPIPFPSAAAADAAAECRAMASLVNDKMSVASTAARHGALGLDRPARGRLQHRLARHRDVGLRTGLERLNRLASDIEAAASAAVAENRRRADLRSEFYRETHRGPGPLKSRSAGLGRPGLRSSRPAGHCWGW
jgi:hypothetical protein